MLVEFKYFILFIYSSFKVDKFTIKTDKILYTNKNSYVLIIKIKTFDKDLANSAWTVFRLPFFNKVKLYRLSIFL